MYFPIHPSSPQFADTLLLTLLLRLLCRCAAPYASRYHIDFKISFCRIFCECAGNHLKNVNANLSGDGPEEGGKGEGGTGQKREGGGEYWAWQIIVHNIGTDHQRSLKFEESLSVNDPSSSPFRRKRQSVRWNQFSPVLGHRWVPIEKSKRECVSAEKTTLFSSKPTKLFRPDVH